MYVPSVPPVILLSSSSLVCASVFSEPLAFSVSFLLALLVLDVEVEAGWLASWLIVTSLFLVANYLNINN